MTALWSATGFGVTQLRPEWCVWEVMVEKPSSTL